jgi:hypothetical protein
MRIYLDTNILQDLKNENISSLLQKVKQDALRNIYCFSEAHLQDLSRDKGDQKFTDMQAMESIVQDNCYFFKQGTQFEHFTPFEYYNSFDWSYTFDTDDIFSGDEMGHIMENIFKLTPLDFKIFIQSDQLPSDMPEEFKALLEQPGNFYEFFQAFMDFTEELTIEQKRFKEFIKYLHQNSLLSGLYGAMGIEGYDGVNITNKDKLRESYAGYFTKNQRRNQYELFMDMYYGLETFGFVKGKPKKQKMMNLINDSRHAFFGAHCDIVVSKDADFRNKAKFMYHICDIETKVLSFEEYETALDQWSDEAALGIVDLINAANREYKETEIIREEKNEQTQTYYFALPQTYLSYFDLYGVSFSEKGNYIFFTKKPSTLANGTFVKEIIKITGLAQSTLGNDAEGRGNFQESEITDGKWAGRYWILGDHVIQLNCPDKLFLSVVPSIFFDEENSSQKETPEP